MMQTIRVALVPSAAPRSLPASHETPDAPLAALREAIWLIRAGPKASMGGWENTYTPQISVAQVERWDAVYQAALRASTEGVDDYDYSHVVRELGLARDESDGSAPEVGTFPPGTRLVAESVMRDKDYGLTDATPAPTTQLDSTLREPMRWDEIEQFKLGAPMSAAVRWRICNMAQEEARRIDGSAGPSGEEVSPAPDVKRLEAIEARNRLYSFVRNEDIDWLIAQVRALLSGRRAGTGADAKPLEWFVERIQAIAAGKFYAPLETELLAEIGKLLPARAASSVPSDTPDADDTFGHEFIREPNGRRDHEYRHSPDCKACKRLSADKEAQRSGVVDDVTNRRGDA